MAANSIFEATFDSGRKLLFLLASFAVVLGFPQWSKHIKPGPQQHQPLSELLDQIGADCMHGFSYVPTCHDDVP